MECHVVRLLVSLLILVPCVCMAQTPAQLDLMKKGYPHTGPCFDNPCAILRTPVEEDWGKTKYILNFVASGFGPADPQQLASLQKRLLKLSGNIRTEKNKRILQRGLLNYLEENPGKFFSHDLPFMATLVMRIDELFPNGLQYITPENPQVHLRKIQVFTLIAAAFLGVIPHNQRALLAHHQKKFVMNQNKLDMFYRGFMERKPKFQSVLIYFASMRERLGNCWNEMVKKGFVDMAPCTGTCTCSTLEESVSIAPTDELIGFYRQSDKVADFVWSDGSVKGTSASVSIDDIAKSTKALGGFEVFEEGDITTSDGDLQVDFADRYLGGLSMFEGYIAQEELIFIIYPEMLCVMLFSDIMKPNEAVVVKGVERFVFSQGYEWTFQITAAAGDWTELPSNKHFSVQGVVPLDSLGRRNVAIVGIDAVQFHEPNKQYSPVMVNRELMKAAVGFKGDPYELIVSGSRQPIATGLWGCGVFNGDAQLKTLIQWLAASYAGRSMKFYTFSNKSVDGLGLVISKLRQSYATVGNLYKAIQNALSRRSGRLGWSLWKELLYGA
ncbi:poly(ADP-ribose) glycohydrolase [Toxoplasma gondii CAST]|uniref:poly(ADP-ribose) glycohydrolase n=1 Tax=Toxoplasma gondii CAST TaxID=943122 RepID=A0A425I2D5_TOXGO|nr:poly(ADP-ribose) glycohydrolase [Toxoplasma gondii CAST]